MQIDKNPYVPQLLLILAANAGVLLVGLALAYWVFEHDIVLGVILVLIALVTLFGFLGLPGAVGDNGEFRESRIRLAVTASLLVMYLAYFGIVVFLATTGSGSTSEERLLPTLTSLLSVVIPFYFGASAAAEISARMKNTAQERQPGPQTAP
jgi:hypothetical protein